MDASFSKTSGRTRASPGEVERQIPAGPFHPFQDMAHLFRGCPERIRNFQGAIRVPGSEPDGFHNGPVAEVGQQGSILPVHQDDQVRPFHEMGRNELGTMVRKVDADVAGFQGIVFGRRLPFPGQQATGGDLKPGRIEKTPEQSFHHGAPANIAVTDHQDPETIREVQDLVPGEGAFLRACQPFPSEKQEIFRMVSDHAGQPFPRIISNFRPCFDSRK